VQEETGSKQQLTANCRTVYMKCWRASVR